MNTQVCSHWTRVLTWRAFCCCMLASVTYNFLSEISNGFLATGFDTGVTLTSANDLFTSGIVLWVVVLAAVGGAEEPARRVRGGGR